MVKMAYNYVILLYFGFILGTIQASDLQVNVDNVWKQDYGWEVTCSWNLSSNDTLQSVELNNNFQKILTYKPQDDGHKRNYVFTRPEDTLAIDCSTKEQGVSGTCVLTMELLQPQENSFMIACIVQGVYEEVKKVTIINTLVPPTNATVTTGFLDKQSGQVKLNCTSSGLLRPNLTWTIGDHEVPQETGGEAWNSTSKLWNVWSLLSYTPSKEHSALCTPEIRTNGRVVKGQGASSAPWWIINSMKPVTMSYDQGPEIHVGCG